MIKPEDQHAFSLVEAILAMTILGIAVSSILTTFSSALLSAKIAEEYANATIMMNELRGNLRCNLLNPYDVNEGNFTLYPNFQWTVEYLETDTDNLFLVNLSIRWSHGNRNYTYKTTTYHYYDIESDLQDEQTEGEGVTPQS